MSLASTPGPGELLRISLRGEAIGSREAFLARYARFIGEECIFLVTRAPRPVGARVRFTLALSDGEVVLAGEGTVTRVRGASDDPQRPPGMELRYVPRDEASRQLAGELLAQRVLCGERLDEGPGAAAVSTPGNPTGVSGAAPGGEAGAPAVDLDVTKPSTVLPSAMGLIRRPTISGWTIEPPPLRSPAPSTQPTARTTAGRPPLPTVTRRAAGPPPIPPRPGPPAPPGPARGAADAGASSLAMPGGTATPAVVGGTATPAMPSAGHDAAARSSSDEPFFALAEEGIEELIAWSIERPTAPNQETATALVSPPMVRPRAITVALVAIGVAAALGGAGVWHYRGLAKATGAPGALPTGAAPVVAAAPASGPVAAKPPATSVPVAAAATGPAPVVAAAATGPAPVVAAAATGPAPVVASGPVAVRLATGPAPVVASGPVAVRLATGPAPAPTKGPVAATPATAPVAATPAAPEPAAAEPGEAVLTVSSLPAGASVSVDGKAAGSTPVTLHVAPGAHAIALAKERYASVTTRTVAPAALELALHRPRATLHITSEPPGGAVLVRGAGHGRTPLSLSLDAFETYDVLVQLRGKTLRKRVYLRAPSTSITLAAPRAH